MLHQTVRRGAVSRIVLCTHARTARNRVDAREPDLNSRYFIPHHSEAGKQTQYKPDVKEQTGAVEDSRDKGAWQTTVHWGRKEWDMTEPACTHV